MEVELRRCLKSSYRLAIEGKMTGIPKSRIPNISVGYRRRWVFTTLGIVEVGYSVLLPEESGYTFYSYRITLFK